MLIFVKNGQMCGQGQLKGQDMIMRDPGKKVKMFKVVIFVIKSCLLMQNLTGSSMALFLFFCVAYFGKKRI